MNTASAQIGVSSPHIRSIILDIVLTLITFGLFNLWVQYKQMQAVNDLLQESKYSFLLWLILTIITFGLYHIYHEYRMARDITTKSQGSDQALALICVVLTIFGLWVVADAIQQAEINRYYGSSKL